MKEKILRVLECQIDGFICPNQTDFRDADIREFFCAIGDLIEAGILRRRNCEGLAYEMVPSLEARLKVAEICKSNTSDVIQTIDREFEK